MTIDTDFPRPVTPAWAPLTDLAARWFRAWQHRHDVPPLDGLDTRLLADIGLRGDAQAAAARQPLIRDPAHELWRMTHLPPDRG